MAAKNSKLADFAIGNSRRIKVTILDDTTGTPIDISGDKLYFTLKDDAADDDTLAVLQAPYTIPGDANAALGIAYLPITAAETAAVPAGQYLYDVVWLRLTSSPGDRHTVDEGKVGFYYPVTHSQS